METGRVRYDQHVRTIYGWRWIAWEDFAIRDAAGKLIEVQSVGRDITERKALEDALTEARDKAEAANRAKSGFLATMSHEIRTPMNGVLGMARLLMESGPLPEQRSYIQAITQSGESLLSLIEEILDFSKIESGTITLEDDNVDLRALVEGVAELLCMRAHAKGVEVVSVIAEGTPEIVRCDELRLRQILTNLVGNAIKFTQHGGVRVNVSQVDGRGRRALRFEVYDTGVGVPVEKRAEIFKEFMQADSSHARQFGGTGLGLAICKRLVDAMEGEIGVEGASDGGSIFWFEIPAFAIHEPQTNRVLEGLSVAIVSRNQVLKDGLAAQIEANGGNVVQLGGHHDTSDTIEADIVLIDAGTGDVPEIAAHPSKGTPAIVLLPPGARSRLGELRGLGFSGYLVKPVRQAAMAERLRAPNNVPTDAVPAEPSSVPVAVPVAEPVAEEPAPEVAQPKLEPEPQLERMLPVEPQEFVRSNAVRAPTGLSIAQISATLTASLPLAPQSAVQVREPEPDEPLPPRVRASQASRSVLLIEDNPINAMLSREFLRRRGYSVTDVASGESALRLLDEKIFDVVLTDLHMPGMDGLTVARRIREVERANGRDRTPVIAVTADADEGIREACQAAGMDGFLTKPIDPSELDAMLETFFETAANAAA
jgi:signal transduction histidine kinase/CheY-like chemotaxis protein